MNNDLISRSELKKAFVEYGEKAKFTQGSCQQLIDNAPTVEERPQGEWIDTDDMNEYWAEEYQCSICGAKDHWHNFCPKCGADMRGEEE